MRVCGLCPTEHPVTHLDSILQYIVHRPIRPAGCGHTCCQRHRMCPHTYTTNQVWTLTSPSVCGWFERPDMLERVADERDLTSTARRRQVGGCLGRCGHIVSPMAECHVPCHCQLRQLTCGRCCETSSSTDERSLAYRYAQQTYHLHACRARCAQVPIAYTILMSAATCIT